jgi:hypothetical protein
LVAIRIVYEQNNESGVKSCETQPPPSKNKGRWHMNRRPLFILNAEKLIIPKSKKPVLIQEADKLSL